MSRGCSAPMSAPSVPRRPGPRRALTEDEILDAALGLLDDGGRDAASVRGIAARVGVAPNAVYTYFPDKAAVIKALVERLLGEVDHDVFADRSRPWRERVEAARAAYLLIVYVFGSMALEVADVHQAGRLPSESDRIAARQRAYSAT